MHLISINLGSLQPDPQNNGQTTGIYKQPVDYPVNLTVLGIENDTIADAKHHGGRDQAVYIYGQDDYDWWQAQLGRSLPPGTFGENLTIANLASAHLSIGDFLQIGAVLLQITAPRIPCATLAARMEDPEFVKKFRHSNRPGAYCRVLIPGTLQPGAAVHLQPYRNETVQLTECYQTYYLSQPSQTDLLRQLRAPIAIRLRERYESKLQKAY